MDDNHDIILFTCEDWERENRKIITEAKRVGINYDPSERTEHHIRYAEETLAQFPEGENIEVQIAYLIKNLICAQRFEFGNKRTARNMVVQFADVNGYILSAETDEWIRICKKVQRKVPKAYIIYHPHITHPMKFYRFIKGTGGGYAVKSENIPMVPDRQGSEWYNPWLIEWVNKHLREKSNQRDL